MDRAGGLRPQLGPSLGMDGAGERERGSEGNDTAAALGDEGLRGRVQLTVRSTVTGLIIKLEPT